MNQNQFCIVAGVVLDDQGKILISRRNDPEVPAAHNKWDLVGGKIEFGESPEAALTREIKEETGIIVNVEKLLPKIHSMIWNSSENRPFQVLIITYLCKKISGELNKIMDRKIFQLKFADLEEIKAMDTMPLVIPLIELSQT